MITLLSSAQQKLLLWLARYTYLTSSQMIRLWIANYRSNISRLIQPLKNDLSIIGEVVFPFVPSKWRLENFYYLLPKGVKLLENSWCEKSQNNPIRFPKWRKIAFTSDYFHRKYTIDCHISCDLFSEKSWYEVAHFDRYFDTKKKDGEKRKYVMATQMLIGNHNLIADWTLLLKHQDQSRLFALEFYNDSNTSRIVEQIGKHLIGIHQSTLCKSYGIKKGHRLLAIFKNESIIPLVKEKFPQTSLSSYLLFAWYHDVMNNFFAHRKSIKNQEILLI